MSKRKQRNNNSYSTSVIYLFVYFFFCHTHGMWKFLGQSSNSYHSNNTKLAFIFSITKGHEKTDKNILIAFFFNGLLQKCNLYYNYVRKWNRLGKNTKERIFFFSLTGFSLWEKESLILLQRLSVNLFCSPTVLIIIVRKSIWDHRSQL